MIRRFSSVAPTTKPSISPSTMARRISSAASRRWRSTAISSSRCLCEPERPLSRVECSVTIVSCNHSWDMTQLQTDQRPFGIRKIADDFAQRIGELAHQRRDSHDLILLRQSRILQEIDHLDLIAPRQVFLAYTLQVLECRNRFRRLACRVKPQLPALA